MLATLTVKVLDAIFLQTLFIFSTFQVGTTLNQMQFFRTIHLIPWLWILTVQADNEYDLETIERLEFMENTVTYVVSTCYLLT